VRDGSSNNLLKDYSFWKSIDKNSLYLVQTISMLVSLYSDFCFKTVILNKQIDSAFTTNAWYEYL
jgi:hypothetical protein